MSQQVYIAYQKRSTNTQCLYLSGIPFLPSFVSSEMPTLDLIADHVEHIAKTAGKTRVGIGSDFDGFGEKPIEGMEDVSHYRALVSANLASVQHSNGTLTLI